jgi:hypothetical protein
MSLSHYAQQNDLRLSPSSRLAFRELGLSIGLHAIDILTKELQAEPARFSNASGLGPLLEALTRYIPLASTIESLWLDPKSQQAQTWLAHRDINEVMLATSVLPTGYLIINGNSAQAEM